MQHRSHISKSVSLTYICAMLLVSSVGVNGQELLTAKNQDAHRVKCTGFIPRVTLALGSPRLCHSKLDGQKGVYACQTVIAETGKYRIYFKGGLRPKAIAKINSQNSAGRLMWKNNQTTEQPVCTLEAASDIPSGSQFLGAGVCENTNDQPVPCAVFRHNPIRTRTYSDYMTFYDPDGGGPRETKIIYTGVNHDAMPAELEYQIGLNLLKTQCCRKRGLKYIEHAHALFPASTLYRATYNRYKTLLSGNRPHQLSSITH